MSDQKLDLLTNKIKLDLIKEVQKLNFSLFVEQGEIIKKISEFHNLIHSNADICIDDHHLCIKSESHEKTLFCISSISDKEEIAKRYEFDVTYFHKVDKKTKSYIEMKNKCLNISFGINITRFFKDIKTITKKTSIELSMLDNNKRDFNYCYTKPKSDYSPEGFVKIKNRIPIKKKPIYKYKYQSIVKPIVLIDFCKSVKNASSGKSNSMVKFSGSTNCLRISFDDEEGGKKLSLGDKKDSSSVIYEEKFNTKDFYNISKILSIMREQITIKYEKNKPLFFHMPITRSGNDDYVNYYIFSEQNEDVLSDDEEEIDVNEECVDDEYIDEDDDDTY